MYIDKSCAPAETTFIRRFLIPEKLVVLVSCSGNLRSQNLITHLTVFDKATQRIMPLRKLVYPSDLYVPPNKMAGLPHKNCETYHIPTHIWKATA